MFNSRRTMPTCIFTSTTYYRLIRNFVVLCHMRTKSSWTYQPDFRSIKPSRSEGAEHLQNQLFFMLAKLILQFYLNKTLILFASLVCFLKQFHRTVLVFCVSSSTSLQLGVSKGFLRKFPMKCKSNLSLLQMYKVCIKAI